jgi:DNA repair protein RadC
MKRPFDRIPKHERPREKLLARGARSLSDQELLAILLGKGTPKMDVMTLAGKLAKVIDERGLELRPADLASFDGVGDAKSTLILAAIEFARRRIKPEGSKIEAPADVLPMIRHYADRKQEHFIAASINGANEVINIRVVSIGLVDRSTVHPREVFADALADRASGVIVAHNHPAGALEPSAWDIEITKQLKAAGDVVGVTLLDHIIFNRTGYYSFLENGVLGK